MEDIIDKMRHSRVELLKTEAQDIAIWSKLSHSKKDLELFLNFNLAEISYKTKSGVEKRIICTSNGPLIKIFSTLTKEKKRKYVKLVSPGFRCKEHDLVKTWDLEDNKLKSVFLKEWQIMNFISIHEHNVLILDEVLHKLLAK